MRTKENYEQFLIEKLLWEALHQMLIIRGSKNNRKRIRAVEKARSR